MKKVLLIDGSPMFREFLRDKLKPEQISVETAIGNRDAYTKLLTLLPDLIIIELNTEITFEMQDLLEKKRSDINAKRIPIIITGPAIENLQVASLAEYGVIKYFKKPIKFDIFFESIGHVLHSNFSMDTTPSILDLHINGNIIFIEISRGLNREKLFILKYKLSEIITQANLREPKIILMLSNLELSFVDGTNIELLFDNILSDERVKPKNLKVLSFDSFISELISGHPQYEQIEVATNLNNILSSFVERKGNSNINDLVTDKILTSDQQLEEGDLAFRISSGNSEKNDDVKSITVAIVDDDVITRKLLQSTLSSIDADAILYESGMEFVKSIIAGKKYDLIILDILIPDMNGFAILKSLQQHNYNTPVIIYSQASSKDAVLQALNLGAKSYLVKPQKPAVIINKALEILRSSN